MSEDQEGAGGPEQAGMPAGEPSQAGGEAAQPGGEAVQPAGAGAVSGAPLATDEPVQPGPAEAAVPAEAAGVRASSVHAPQPGWSRQPVHPFTLAVDVGGTGIKASVLDAEDRMVADRVRVATKYPLSPEQFVAGVAELVRPLPSFDRVSVGFPGVVRAGRVLTAPHFVTAKGPGSKVVPELLAAWTGFAAADALAAALGEPVRVANDADLQGLAVVRGKGLELVVTLGTGVGTGLFVDGVLAPHLELAHHPFRKGQTYNEQLGEAALERIGPKKWRRRVERALGCLTSLINFDTCYIGGGNSRHLTGRIDPSYVIVDNVAGILGGIRLWEREHHL